MKTEIGYKLFRVIKSRPGELFSLYVNANQTVPIGIWLDAEAGERIENGKVKSKLGELKFRPGWHINDDIPYVSHIGIKENGKITYMRNDVVWCEVEYCTDVDYTLLARQNGIINGKYDPKKACLEQIPADGFYKYKTNPNMFGEWIIAGKMKVNRVMSDQEVSLLCQRKGIKSLPRQKEFDYKQYGFAV